MDEVNTFIEGASGSNFVPSPIRIDKDQKAEIDYWAEEFHQKGAPILEKLFESMEKADKILNLVTHRLDNHVIEIRKVRINNLE